MIVKLSFEVSVNCVCLSCGKSETIQFNNYREFISSVVPGLNNLPVLSQLHEGWHSDRAELIVQTVTCKYLCPNCGLTVSKTTKPESLINLVTKITASNSKGTSYLTAYENECPQCKSTNYIILK